MNVVSCPHSLTIALLGLCTGAEETRFDLLGQKYTCAQYVFLSDPMSKPNSLGLFSDLCCSTENMPIQPFVLRNLPVANIPAHFFNLITVYVKMFPK